MTEPHANQPPAAAARRAPEHRPVLAGVFLIALGVAFLLDELDVLSIRQMLRFWPLVLVVLGVRQLWGARDRRAGFTGAALIGAGGLFLLDSLDIVDFDIWDLWPLILVAIGFRMLAFPASRAPAARGGDDGVEDWSISFGSIDRRIRSEDYRGGSASAFMGGVKLDLRDARMAGGEAVLRVSVTMGGVQLRIPEDWAVDNRCTVMFGGVEDRTRGSDGATKRLVLEGSVFMGGVEIRN